MTRGDAILATVRRIHDASLTADAWQPALQSIIELVGGDHAILLARDTEQSNAAFATSAGMDERSIAGFLSPEAVRWIGPPMQTIPSGAVVTRSRLVPDRQFERTDFYNDVVRPVGGFHALSVCHKAPTLSSFFAVCRRRQAGDFETDDVALMQTLSPHVATALAVRQRLGAADLGAKAAWAALERLSTGVIVVDAVAAVIHANMTAEQLFRERGLRLDRDGICTGEAAASSKLRRLIAACSDIKAPIDAGGAVEIPRGQSYAALRIVATPFQPERIGCNPGWCTKPLALLLVSDPEQKRHGRMATLRRRFGLTAAEAEFALEITRGDGRAAAAARSKITVGTARTHLEHIFEKTGVRRQAELVRLILSDG